MSTLSTQLNWGASYLVNDVYRRFWQPGRDARHYANAGRVATLVMMVIAGIVTYYIGSVEGAWKFLLALGAGTGLVYLLRWYWWRINAWSEVSAMATALVVSLAAQAAGLGGDDPRGFAWLLLLTTVVTTVVWLGVTYGTSPEPAEKLREFYARARPGGPGWRAIVATADADAQIGGGLLRWAAGCIVVYLGLFGIGGLVLGHYWQGVIALVIAVALTAWLVSATEAETPARGSEVRVV
jgi:Na+/proline symporter